MLELFKKHQKTVIIVGSVLILLLISSFVYLNRRGKLTPQLRQTVNTSETTETTKGKGTEQIKDTTKEVTPNDSSRNGEPVTAWIPSMKAMPLYNGTIVNTYPETGTVIMDRGGWLTLVQFNYNAVVDIQATSWEVHGDDWSPEDETNIMSINQTIRAVQLEDGRLVALRTLDGTSLELGNIYKIVDPIPNETPDRLLKNYELLDSNWETLPTHVYEFVKEHGR